MILSLFLIHWTPWPTWENNFISPCWRHQSWGWFLSVPREHFAPHCYFGLQHTRCLGLWGSLVLHSHHSGITALCSDERGPCLPKVTKTHDSKLKLLNIRQVRQSLISFRVFCISNSQCSASYNTLYLFQLFRSNIIKSLKLMVS